MKKIKIISFIAIIFSLAVTAHANEMLLIAEDGNPSDQFGLATAVSGDYAIIGANYNDGSASNAGAAYIFKNIEGKWTQVQKLVSASNEENQYFGHAVDICGKYAVVGAYGYQSSKGATYIFELVGDTWQYIKGLTAPDAASGYKFGCAVAANEQYLLIGSQDFNKTSGYHNGKAYMYKISDWSCQQLEFTTHNEHQYFGRSVALSDNYAIVGASHYSGNNGYIRIYQLQNGNWTNIKNFSGSDNEYWGYAVDITEKFAIIGSHYYNNQQGRALIYDLDSWTNTQLTGSGLANSDYFGRSTALNDNYAIIGSYYDDDNGSNSGSAYIFKNNNGSWTQIAKMTASDGYNNEYYGYNVSLSDQHFFIGAYNKAKGTGGVYVYPNNQYTISGYIYDKDNNPVPLAVVNFTNASSAVSDGNGFYLNTLFLGWSGNVTVQKGHYLFSPSARRFEKIFQNYTDQNFYPQLFTISGFVKDPTGNPLNGVTIQFNNDGGTTSTNSEGFYSHEVLNNWSGVATPTFNGYKFTPLNISFSSVTENQSEQHFIAQRYTISGFVTNETGLPMDNVTIVFSNNGGKTQTNAQGIFSHDIDYQWSGTLIPEKSGYDFNPQSLTFNPILSNQINQHIVATERTYDIWGQIKDQDGSPLSGVRLCFGSDSTCIETDTSGNYLQAVPFQWTGDVSPQKAGYYFIPETLPYQPVLADQESQNYSAIIHTCLISGVIQENGQALNNVIIHCNGDDVLTDNDGRFRFETYYGWTGTISPEKEGYAFTPPDYAFVSGIETNMPQMHFNAEKKTFTISGTIVDPDNLPVSEVSIKFPGIGIVYTNNIGNYQCEVPYGWSGSTELFKSNYVFAPKHADYVYVKENKPQNYNAVYSPTPTLMAKINQRSVSSESGQVAFEIMTSPSDLSWGFNEPAYSWIHLEKDGSHLMVSFDANPDVSSRTATLTVQATDAVNSPQILTVIQEAKPEEIPGPDWQTNFDPTEYQYLETITAIVKDDTQALFENPDDMLAAFAGDECRGIAHPIETSTGKRYFLQIWSNEYSEEEIAFKFYDAARDRINVNIKYPIVFESGKSLGSIDFPHTFEITDFYIRLALNKHWNWVSINVMNENMSVNTVLSSLQDKGIIVIGQEGYAQYMALHDHWDGSLQSIDSTHMYLLKTNDPVMLEFSGNALDVSQMPLNLTNGWNWLGYLPYDNMPVNEALTSLNGNARQICGQNGFAVYLDGEGWFGSLETLEANHGYQIYMSTEDILTYPSTSQARSARTRSIRKSTQRSSVNGWSFDASLYQHQCTLTSTVIMDNQSIGSAGDALVAFVDGVCRGIAYPSETPVGTRFFLQIWGSENEITSLKYYQADQNKVHDISTRVEIIPNQIYGDIYQVHELYIGVPNHAPQWTVNSEQYQYQETVVASMDIQGITMTSSDDILAVFANGECRGLATPKETPYGTRFFIQVWSNTSGESMTYKYYKASDDSVYDIQESLTFSINASLGDIETPEQLSMINNSDIIENLESTIITQKETIDDLTSNLNQKETRITNLEQSVNQKDVEIGQLTTEVQHLNTTISDKTDEIQELSDNIAAIINTYGKYSKQLQPGWYLIGGINATVVPRTVPEHAIAQMYTYKNGAYQPATQFEAGGGYWIKISTPCELILEDLSFQSP